MIGRLALLELAGCLTAAPLIAQISGVVLNDSGRVDPGAMVDLTGPKTYQRVSLSADGRFVFRGVRDTDSLWVEAFHESRFSSRLRVTTEDTALRLVLRWPPRTGLRASQTLFTRTVHDRAFEAGVIRCEGPACALEVSDTTGTIYCWSTIVGAQGDTVVEHVWYWGDREVARVRLPVRGPRWRTWSSKRIVGLSGTWRVEVVTADGAVLAERVLTVASSTGHRDP